MTKTTFQKKNLLNVRADVLMCLFLVISIFVVYWQVRNYGFVNYDDDIYVKDNLHVEKGLTLGSIAWALTATHASNWHPLTWLSHMLDFQLYGMNPGQHHLTNVLFHILNTLLLFFVFKRMTKDLWQSGFVAALFGLHPLHVESVAWVAERKDVLSTFFWMMTVWSYIRYVERSRVDRYLLVLTFFIFGLMAKPMLVTLPFVLLLLDYWPLNRFQIKNSETRMFSLSLIWEKIPLFVISAASSFVTYIVQKSGGTVSPLDVISLKQRIANVMVSYITYIGKMIVPHELAVLYPYPKFISLWKVGSAGLLLVAISVAVFRIKRTKPYFAVGWFWYLGTLVPVIGLIQVGFQAMADRYTYVPLIGLSIIVAWGVPDILGKWRIKSVILAILSAIILSALTLCTGFQIRCWKNSIALFEHAKNVTQNNYVAYHKLGDAVLAEGQVDTAIKYYSEAIRIKPDFIPARINMGVALRKDGKLEKALDQLSKALSLKKNFATIHYEIGLTLEEMGRYDEAISHFRKVLRINPDHAKAYNNLGVILARQGEYKEAIASFYKAIRIDTRYAGAYYNIGKLFTNQGKFEDAILNYRKALLFNPDNTQALYTLAWILATHKNEEFRNGVDAVRLAERLCNITQYNDPLALDALAAAYAESGKFAKAVLTAKKAQKMAVDQGMKQLSLRLKNRLELYQVGIPYRQTLTMERSQPYD